MRKRNPVLAVLLSLVTFGIYYVYWFYDTNAQFSSELGDGSHPILRTIVLFFPPFSLISIYKHSRSCEDATDGHDWLLLFLAHIVFAPIAIFVVQADINDAVDNS